MIWGLQAIAAAKARSSWWSSGRQCVGVVCITEQLYLAQLQVAGSRRHSRQQM
jgi:hypothetical protein